MRGAWVLLLACACGGAGAEDGDAGQGGGVAGVDAGEPADARPGAADANRSDCPDGLPADLGKVTPLLLDQNQTDEYYFLFASVSDEPDPVQQFAMRIYKDRGPLGAGALPGSFSIGGADADYQTCDVCVFLYAEKDELPYAFFTADSGLLTIDEVGEELTGQLENVHLRQVDIVNDGAACEPGDDSCGNTSCIDNQCGRQHEMGDCDTKVGQLAF
ncbi:MAG TPA: hypothetical protein VMZ28_16595 [Kofleriaceae bacterium]|nr:hypothetical protein [Kofleriaceae bacterium]